MHRLHCGTGQALDFAHQRCPHDFKAVVYRAAAGGRSLQQRTRRASALPQIRESVFVDQASKSMTAQVDAKSRISVQEMVDLAVVWASQHGLVSLSSCIYSVQQSEYSNGVSP